MLMTKLGLGLSLVLFSFSDIRRLGNVYQGNVQWPGTTCSTHKYI